LVSLYHRNACAVRAAAGAGELESSVLSRYAWGVCMAVKSLTSCCRSAVNVLMQAVLSFTHFHTSPRAQHSFVAWPSLLAGHDGRCGGESGLSPPIANFDLRLEMRRLLLVIALARLYPARPCLQ